jgi:hypothetical protein
MPACAGGEQLRGRPQWASLPFSSVRVFRDQRDDQGGVTGACMLISMSDFTSYHFISKNYPL